MTKSAVKEREPALDLQVEFAPQNKPPAVRGKAKVAEPASSATISTALVAAASNPQVDAAKMKALWDLHKEIKAEEARVAFLHDFHAMSRKMPIIDKNGRIVIEAKPGKRGQSTSYPKYDEVHEVLKPLLDEFNFIMDHATEPNEAGDRINVVSYLRHTGGHETRTVFPLPAETSGSKNNVQGWGSSNSYGKRYNTINLLNINSKAPEDKDRDAHAAEDDQPPKTAKPLDAEQLAKLRAAIKFCGVGENKFCEKYEIEKVADLPVGHFNEAMKACQDYAAKRNSDG